nr:hypothetical protein [Pseudomonas aeruginosa]
MCGDRQRKSTVYKLFIYTGFIAIRHFGDRMQAPRPPEVDVPFLFITIKTD